MEVKLKAVHTEEERARIRDEMAARAEVARQEAARRQHKAGVKGAGGDATPTAPVYRKVEKKNYKDDPLDGLKL